MLWGEARSYSLAFLSILTALFTAGMLLALFKSSRTKARIPKGLRIPISFLLAVCGLAAMHLLNRPHGAPVFRLTASLPALTAYAMTILLFVLIGSLANSMREERALLEKLAYVDKVTGLQNMNGMDNFWNRNKGRERLAVLFLDLNRFKNVNDTLGHHVGDMLLHEVGVRLSRFVSRKRLIFRVGGDEFVIIARGCSQREAEQLAVGILERLNAPYTVDKHTLSISGSIGISMNRSHEKLDRARLMREADSAMYQAKNLGTSRYCVYRRPA